MILVVFNTVVGNMIPWYVICNSVSEILLSKYVCGCSLRSLPLRGVLPTPYHSLLDPLSS